MRALMRRIFISIEIIGTSALYQEWIQEGKTAGIAEGEAEGEAEGKAEGEATGKAEGVRDTVLALLRARFGELAPEIPQAVAAIGIERLASSMPTFATEGIAAVHAQLGLAEA